MARTEGPGGRRRHVKSETRTAPASESPVGELLFPDGVEAAVERARAALPPDLFGTPSRRVLRKPSGSKPPDKKPPAKRPPGKKPPIDHQPPGQIPDNQLDRYCKKLLAELEKNCPGLLPTGPVPAGEVTDRLDVEGKDLERLVLSAVGVEDRRRRNQVIWERAGSELLVHLNRTRIAVLDGLVLIGITVETVETKRVEVTVPFGVGHPDRLAGMVVTAEAKPRGPATIVDLWGEALTAFAWQALLDVIERLAARTGVDQTGTPLLPGALVAQKGKLGLVPQAAHSFEGARR